MKKRKVLMVLTSHATLGDTGEKTGFWLEEFAAPYYVFVDAKYAVTLASPAGGAAPMDPRSDTLDSQTDATRRYEKDADAKTALAATQQLMDVNADEFDAVFFPGGHGPMWDLATDTTNATLVSAFFNHGKPVAAVCHGPAALVKAVDNDGRSIISHRRVTGFTNSEEAAVGLTKVVPFLLEDRLKALGGKYVAQADWQSHVEEDGHLITGQNPASSVATAKALIAQLEKG